MPLLYDGTMIEQIPPRSPDSLQDPLAPLRQAKTMDELVVLLVNQHTTRLEKARGIRAKVEASFSDDAVMRDQMLRQVDDGIRGLEDSHQRLMRLVEEGRQANLTPASLLEDFRNMMN